MMKLKKVEFMPTIKQRAPAPPPEPGSPDKRMGSMAYWLDDTMHVLWYSDGIVFARAKGGTEIRGYAPGIYGSFTTEEPTQTNVHPPQQQQKGGGR